MSVLDRKLGRDFWQTKGLLLTIATIVAAGAAAFVSLRTAWHNLDRARRSYYSRCRMADFWIDLRKMPVSETAPILETPGVADVRTRIRYPVVVDMPAASRPIGGEVLSLPPEPRPAINGVVMATGSYFTGRRLDEVIVSKRFAEAWGLGPGDHVALIMKGQHKRLLIVGTALCSEFIVQMQPGSLANDPQGWGLFWVRRDYAEDTFGMHGACNSVVGLLTPAARQRPRPVLDRLERYLDPYGVVAATPRADQFSHLTISAEMDGLRVMAAFLPTIFLGVAALVLNVLMIRLAQQQRITVGTLKALGCRSGPIALHFLAFGLVVGAVGAAAGGAIGFWLAGLLVRVYREYFEFPHLLNQVYPQVMFVALVVALVFAVVGTLRGIGTVLRLQPAEAMRDNPPAEGGAIFLERWQGLWRRLDFRWHTTLRGFFRHKVRTAVTVVAATLGAALVFVSFGMSQSVGRMLSFQFDKILRGDFSLTLRDAVDHRAVAEVRALPGVLAVEPVLDVTGTFRHGPYEKKMSIQGLLPGARLTVPRDTDGRRVPVPSVGILLTRRLADQLHLAVGDSVQFVPVREEHRPRRLPVVGVVDTTFGLAVYADYAYLNRVMNESAALTALQLETHQTPRQRRAFVGRLRELPAIQGMADIARQKQIMKRDFVRQLQANTVIMIVFAGVIFFGSILNSSLIAIAERRRQIATFRVLGYRLGQVSELFLRENLLLNVLGAVLGLPLGYWLLQALATMFANDIYKMPVAIDAWTWIGTVLCAVVFVLASHVIVHLALYRLDWRQAIRIRE